MKKINILIIICASLIFFFVSNSFLINTCKSNNPENSVMQSDTPVPYIFCEGFNSSAFPPQGWELIYTGTNYIARVPISAFCIGSGAVIIDFYNMLPGRTEQLNTLIFQPTGEGDSLIFVDSYDANFQGNDKLQIKTSIDGGASWTDLVSLNGGNSGELVSCFSPPCGLCVNWKFQRIALPVGVNRIQFNGISAWSTDLYLDSICVKSALIGIKKIESNIPKDFYLSQNYPNPFNPSTSIEFAISKTTSTKLVVIDQLGREVETLVNEELKAGSYKVDFDGSKLSSGVYYYKLITGDFTDTKKMVLIK